jgi:SAM-dependent methyltransferase
MAVVAETNRDQAAAWDGPEGAFWAENAENYERAVEDFDDAIFAAAAIGPASRVLDVGCGTGSTTRRAARLASNGTAFGIDLSAAMVRVAAERAAAAGLTNARFVHGDAQVHDFPAARFDVALARTSVMFFGDPVAALANVRRALAAGARLVATVWQEPGANEWFGVLVGALTGGRGVPSAPPGGPGPFALTDPDRCRAVLRDAGYQGARVESVAARMRFGADADDGARFVLGQFGWLLAGRDQADVARAEDELRAALRAHERPGGVLFDAHGWLLTATA